MRPLDTFDAAARLRQAASDHNVPGASLAIWHDGTLVGATHGLVNIDTGVEVTPETLFQVGSITKPFTGVLTMMAVERGLLDLDASVARYLPGLVIGREPLPEAITVRMLLNHTSGIDGDLFIDTGDGDDCLERYTERLSETAMVFTPGRHYSYCNVGYCLLGRLQELVFGQPWDQVLRAHLLEPLGMTRATTLAERAVFSRCAVGHHWPRSASAPVVLPYQHLPHALGPAGLTMMATATELIRFGRMLAGEGRAPGGQVILSPATHRALVTPEVPTIDGAHWGLSVKVEDWGGERLVSHDGGTIGQSGFLWTIPERRFVFALLANGGDTASLFRDLFHPLVEQGFGVTEPGHTLSPVPMDLAVYEGAYENIGVRMEMTARSDHLDVEIHHLQVPMPTSPLRLRPLDRSRFLAEMEGLAPTVMAFQDFNASGRPDLFYAGRMHRRVSEGA